MKTLVKLAKSNRYISTLQNILVVDGVARATDCQTQITVKSDLPNGLYHAEGFGSLNVPSDLGPSDFALKIEAGKALGSLSLNKSDIETFTWVSEAMSTEESRYYLRGIYFNGNHVVATDGSRLNLWRLDTSLPQQKGKGFICPDDAVKYALATAKELKASEMTICFYEQGIAFVIGDACIVSKLIDGTYPDYERVYPKTFQHTVKWDNQDIQKALKEIKVLGKINKNRIDYTGGYKVVLNGAISYGNKTWPLSQKMPFNIGFDTAYLGGLISGDMGLNDPRSPVVVTSGDKTAVLMPMRV